MRERGGGGVGGVGVERCGKIKMVVGGFWEEGGRLVWGLGGRGGMLGVIVGCRWGAGVEEGWDMDGALWRLSSIYW